MKNSSLTATVNTKSNYQGFNGKSFPIHEILHNGNKLMYCLDCNGIKVDFAASEITINEALTHQLYESPQKEAFGRWA